MDIMNSKDIYSLAESHRFDYEQLSLPYVVLDNERKKIGFYTFKFYMNEANEMTIQKFYRLFLFDLETSDFEVRSIDKGDENFRVVFDNLIDIDDIDQLYENYFKTLDNYLKEKASIDDLNVSMSKIMPKTFMNIYKLQGALISQKEEVETPNQDVTEPTVTDSTNDEDVLTTENKKTFAVDN